MYDLIVSIPYSTIKSFTAKTGELLPVYVSIPYSTIKSLAERLESIVRRGFNSL